MPRDQQQNEHGPDFLVRVGHSPCVALRDSVIIQNCSVLALRGKLTVEIGGLG